jgi:hypothetical protein
VQVDPIQPLLKPSGINRLQLEHDEPLSTFAFQLKLCHYKELVPVTNVRRCYNIGKNVRESAYHIWSTKVGRCRLTLSNPCRNRLELRAVQVDPIKPILKPPGTGL